MMRLSLIFIILLSACATSAPDPVVPFGATLAIDEVEVKGRIAIFTLRLTNRSNAAWSCTGEPTGFARSGRPIDAGYARIAWWRFTTDGVDRDLEAWVTCLNCEESMLGEVLLNPGEHASAIYAVPKYDCASQVGVVIKVGDEEQVVWSDKLGPHLRRADRVAHSESRR